MFGGADPTLFLLPVLKLVIDAPAARSSKTLARTSSFSITQALSTSPGHQSAHPRSFNPNGWRMPQPDTATAAVTVR
ncbi:hypothetical protein [Kitasatospora aureofaciens]|uniref:hypothetical protein n=1 Tax=Kitasatospora aureofaciens TaxID=1894 RepID=UPI000AD349B5|nr:hypothetical protein [Kitasatospora aureofaciens]HJD80263.1 hypothetical protein [Kitasatospora aureofaciens]